jgi:hypothetical protein
MARPQAVSRTVSVAQNRWRCKIASERSPPIQKEADTAMAPEEEEGSRGTVRVAPNLVAGVTYPADDWIFPREMEATWTAPDGHVTAIVAIEGDNGRARARSITVTTDAARGLGWRALGQVPIRDVVAAAVRWELRKVGLDDGKPFYVLEPGPEDAEAVEEIVRVAVGYRPRTEGLRREP